MKAEDDLSHEHLGIQSDGDELSNQILPMDLNMYILWYMVLRQVLGWKTVLPETCLCQEKSNSFEVTLTITSCRCTALEGLTSDDDA